MKSRSKGRFFESDDVLHRRTDGDLVERGETEPPRHGRLPNSLSTSGKTKRAAAAAAAAVGGGKGTRRHGKSGSGGSNSPRTRLSPRTRRSPVPAISGGRNTSSSPDLDAVRAATGDVLAAPPLPPRTMRDISMESAARSKSSSPRNTGRRSGAHTPRTHRRSGTTSGGAGGGRGDPLAAVTSDPNILLLSDGADTGIGGTEPRGVMEGEGSSTQTAPSLMAPYADTDNAAAARARAPRERSMSPDAMTRSSPRAHAQPIAVHRHSLASSPVRTNSSKGSGNARQSSGSDLAGRRAQPAGAPEGDKVPFDDAPPGSPHRSSSSTRSEVTRQRRAGLSLTSTQRLAAQLERMRQLVYQRESALTVIESSRLRTAHVLAELLSRLDDDAHDAKPTDSADSVDPALEPSAQTPRSTAAASLAYVMQIAREELQFGETVVNNLTKRLEQSVVARTSRPYVSSITPRYTAQPQQHHQYQHQQQLAQQYRTHTFNTASAAGTSNAATNAGTAASDHEGAGGHQGSHGSGLSGRSPLGFEDTIRRSQSERRPRSTAALDQELDALNFSALPPAASASPATQQLVFRGAGDLPMGLTRSRSSKHRSASDASSSTLDYSLRTTSSSSHPMMARSRSQTSSSRGSGVLSPPPAVHFVVTSGGSGGGGQRVRRSSMSAAHLADQLSRDTSSSTASSNRAISPDPEQSMDSSLPPSLPPTPGGSRIDFSTRTSSVGTAGTGAVASTAPDSTSGSKTEVVPGRKDSNAGRRFSFLRSLAGFSSTTDSSSAAAMAAAAAAAGGGSSGDDDFDELRNFVHAVDFDADDVIFCENLGRGGAASVFRATVAGFSVAAKVFNTEALGRQERKMIYEEVLLMETLDHPNLVKYLGHEFSRPGLDIVYMELFAGTLRDELDRAREANAPFAVGQLLQFLAQICSGLAYLHGFVTPIVHLDIKSANVLTAVQSSPESTHHADGTKKYRLAIADFGESAKLKRRSGKKQQRSNVGTPEFMAPELIQVSAELSSRYGVQADMWSLGMVIFEMLSLDLPYRCSGVKGFEVLDRIKSGIRPSFPLTVLPEHEPLVKMFIQCTSLKPSDRPSASQLLAKIYKELGD